MVVTREGTNFTFTTFFIFNLLLSIMSFHPEDDILDLIREAKEEYELEMKEMDTTFED